MNNSVISQWEALWRLSLPAGSPGTYSTVVSRDDGVGLQIASFDRPKWLSHDMAHYIVEHELLVVQ